MRRNPHLSLTRAAQDAETTPGAVRRYAGTSLTKERGRVRTTKSDRLYRPMKVAIDTPGMSRGGALGGEVRSIGISSSRTATAVGRHWSALQRYLHHGDYAALAKYRGRTFTADGVTYTFLTDRDKIAELADLGHIRSHYGHIQQCGLDCSRTQRSHTSDTWYGCVVSVARVSVRGAAGRTLAPDNVSVMWPSSARSHTLAAAPGAIECRTSHSTERHHILGRRAAALTIISANVHRALHFLSGLGAILPNSGH